MDAVHSERSVRAALGWLAEPGDQRLQQVLQVHGPAEVGHLLSRGQVPVAVRAELRNLPRPLLWEQASAALARAERTGWRVVIPSDEQWPAGLSTVVDGWQPICLWACGPGQLPQLTTSVTVVGSRAATSYGQHLAAGLAGELAARGWTVVSTPAFGVDGCALRGALVADPARAVAVVPHGGDQIHPPQQRTLLGQLAERGLLVSAWPAGARPNHERRRVNLTLLAAMSAGTVVVEASLRSAAVQVARRAAAAGRLGMVVPGPVTSAMSAGCHHLLRTDGRIRLVTDVDDIVADLPHRGDQPRPGGLG
ncbi:DNA-processing protein DprA [Phytohabitans houttuyneae]|uniref:DNA-processing protein DprA n=1 Tax=Phytohabitans houttuyneae TaxID=1076126 RepID=UPI0031E65C87